jgi:hypothetical protein
MKLSRLCENGSAKKTEKTGEYLTISSEGKREAEPGARKGQEGAPLSKPGAL